MNKYHDRLKKLQATLSDAALYLDEPMAIFYLTGMRLSKGVVLLYRGSADLIVDGRYALVAKKNSPIPVHVSDTSNDEMVATLLRQPDYSSIHTLAFDTHHTTFKTYLSLQQLLQKVGRSISLLPLDNPLEKVRIIKDAEEIELLAEAAAVGSAGFDYILSLLHEGVTEVEIANELEIFWKRQGCKGVAFEPIIAFGPNSAMPHYHPGDATLKQGDNVLIDIGVNYNHYNSDMTRVVYFGEVDPQIKTIYNVVEKAQLAAIVACKPGITAGELDAVARTVITEHGYGHLFTHNLGHGVGLDVHEAPWIRCRGADKDLKLAPGMVLTIEPGVYLPDVGGVRLEDTVVVTNDGCRTLTNRSLNPYLLS